MSTSTHAEWYRNATVYSVDVETFRDADGDGVGDFEGLTSEVGYLDNLGVSCLWLLPFYATPNRDNGYDVADYYSVDSRLGTLGDFVDFVHRAESHGLRVITDLVVNHTSNEHEWFQRARENPDSPYRDYYVWTDDPAEEETSRDTVFPGEEEDVWTYDEVADAYYYHRFYHFQPDLNLTNPDVRDEIRKVMNFWLELGVDGFRVDAATLMIDRKGPVDPLADPHEILRGMRRIVDERTEDGILLAEADDDPAKLAEYFGRDDEFHLLLNFVLNAYVTLALARGESAPVEKAMGKLDAKPEWGQWGNFLRNFDELNVGRLDREEQADVFEAFAPDSEMRIYGRGIRRRLAAILDGDERRILLAHGLLCSLSGTPVVVAGDEIGMGDDLSLAGRNPVRTPMQWSDDRNAGFSAADPADLVRPVVDEGTFSYERVNVAAQQSDPDSLLNGIRRLLAAHRECPEFGRGGHESLNVGPESVLAHRAEWGDGVVVAVHNLADESREVTVDRDPAERRVHKVVGPAEFEAREDGTCDVALDGYGYCWLRLGGTPTRPPGL